MYLSVKQGDEAAFERNYAQVGILTAMPRASRGHPSSPALALLASHACSKRVHSKCPDAHTSPPPPALPLPQLRVYYADARALLPPSDQEASLTALNLLRLLVQVGEQGGIACSVKYRC